tara:strand:- start:453 stop:698 length:246 start_codon:yes stop_codon:yes gene_type:complete
MYKFYLVTVKTALEEKQDVIRAFSREHAIQILKNRRDFSEWDNPVYKAKCLSRPTKYNPRPELNRTTKRKYNWNRKRKEQT